MKNPAAVALGSLGGKSTSPKKKAAVILNLEKARAVRATNFREINEKL